MHGTVNVLLANASGVALVTDSRLSNQFGQPRGNAPKLFVLDDHTICAIADFYSDEGPKLNAEYPAATNVPGIIKAFLYRREHANLVAGPPSIALTLDDLIQIYTFALGMLANLNSAEDLSRITSGAELTVAGYENKALHVAQVRLAPVWDGRMWTFQQFEKRDDVVLDVVTKRFAGVTKTANRLLENPLSAEVKSDPILSNFDSELARDGGKNLSLEDLRQEAVRLKQKTSQDYPKIVGGPTQSIVMFGGKILSNDLLESTLPARYGAGGGMEVSGITIVLPKGALMGATSANAPSSLLNSMFVDFGVKGGREPIDGKAYIRSNFSDTGSFITGAVQYFSIVITLS